MSELSVNEKAATVQPRGTHGRFAPKAKPQPIPSPGSPVSNFLKDETQVSATHDDKTLLNVHIGNPLRKITELLEEIKKQKAFSFTLKGSLGLMGVFLALSVFGLFGTTHALCDKGVQTHIGIVNQLHATDEADLSILGKLESTYVYYQGLLTSHVQQETPTERYVLVKTDFSVLHLLPVKSVGMKDWVGKSVFLTGKYDSCSQEMEVKNGEDIQEVE